MSKQLYEEALADIKKLKEIAEDNAKRAILEAVTPRIKDLIENQLLGEDKKEDMVDDDLLLDDMPDVVPSVAMDNPEAADAISMPDEEGKFTLDLSALSAPDTGEISLSMDDEEAVDALMPPMLSKQVRAESLIRKIEKKTQDYAKASSTLKETKGYLLGIVSTISEVENMYSTLQKIQETSDKKVLITRLKECYRTLKKLMEQEMNTTKRFSLNEEDITMKLKLPPDAEVDPDEVEIELITGEEGGEESEEEEGEELELSDEEGDEESEEDSGEEGGEESSEEEGEEEEEKMETRSLKGNIVVEIDENMLRREISRMRSLREAAEDADVQAWGHGPGEVSDEFEDEDLGDPFVDVDLSEAYESDSDPSEAVDEVDDHNKDEADMHEVDEDDMHEVDEDDMHEVDEDDMHEVDEVDELDQVMQVQKQQGQKQQVQKQQVQKQQGQKQQGQKQQGQKQQANLPETLKRRLAAEQNLQLEAKKKATQAKKMQMKTEKDAKQAKTQSKKMQAKKQSARLKEAYNYYAQQFNESVKRTRKLQGMLAEATARKESTRNGGSQRLAEETVTLREKLAETNLFNAKLLYTNKLLQNESLTKRQKAEVIERLDEAENVREVKLVYESLVKALQGGSTGRMVSESTSRGVVGSSSRPARPAATTTTLNEGFEAERWAKLAGIIK